MEQENNPIALVQNPAFGAQLLWKTCEGFRTESDGLPVPLPCMFVVLPILLHGRTLEEVRSTNQSSGLTKFVSKLMKERDLLIAVHDRALRMRELTLQSISTGVGAGLLQVEYDTGFVHSLPARVPPPPQRSKVHVASAEKLGRWFARLPCSQVFALLQVTA